MLHKKILAAGEVLITTCSVIFPRSLVLAFVFLESKEGATFSTSL
jgi:hypothetical protein